MLPLAYFPTKVVFVDDNYDFLNFIMNTLNQSKRQFMGFGEVKDAITYLNDVYKPDYYLNRYTSLVDEPAYENRTINIEIYNIHHEVYNKERFKQISTLVIDYDMSYMNGIDACKMIKDPYVQKILLTSMADENVAIQGFNDGVIDYYLRKDDPKLAEKMEALLNKAQENYFKLISTNIAKLITWKDWRPSALQDPVYQQLLKEIIKKYDIVEYYIIETAGSYLLLMMKQWIHLPERHFIQIVT
jgi:CheY-like chemotaxis protein